MPGRRKVDIAVPIIILKILRFMKKSSLFSALAALTLSGNDFRLFNDEIGRHSFSDFYIKAIRMVCYLSFTHFRKITYRIQRRQASLHDACLLILSMFLRQLFDLHMKVRSLNLT